MPCSCHRCSHRSTLAPSRSGGLSRRLPGGSVSGVARGGWPRSSVSTQRPRPRGCDGRARPSPGRSPRRRRPVLVRAGRACMPRSGPREPGAPAGTPRQAPPPRPGRRHSGRRRGDRREPGHTHRPYAQPRPAGGPRRLRLCTGPGQDPTAAPTTGG